MRIDFKTILKIVLFFGGGLLFIYLAFRNQNFSKILLKIETANLYWIAVSILCTFSAQVLRALRWFMLFKNFKSLKFSNTYHALVLGYLSNLIIPRIGELVRCTVLYKTNKIPVFTALGTVVIERIFDLTILMLGLFYILFFQNGIVVEFFLDNIFKPIGLIFIENWLIILSILFVVFGLVIHFYKSYKLKTINSKFLRLTVYLIEGLNSFKNLEHKTLFILFSVAIWIFNWLAIFAGFKAFNFTSFLGFEVAFSVMIFSTLAMLTPVQAGFGVYHWLITQCLILYAIQAENGLTYATVMHFSHLFLTVFLGLISIVFYLKRIR